MTFRVALKQSLQLQGIIINQIQPSAHLLRFESALWEMEFEVQSDAFKIGATGIIKCEVPPPHLMMAPSSTWDHWCVLRCVCVLGLVGLRDSSGWTCQGRKSSDTMPPAQRRKERVRVGASEALSCLSEKVAADVAAVTFC